jgi:arylformamidase
MSPLSRSSEWIDISVPVSPGATPLWPGSTPITFDAWSSLAAGDPVNETVVRMSVHTGTHVDAPAHFLKEGATVEQLDPGAMLGPCRVTAFPGVRTITSVLLEEAEIPAGTERLLLKTDNELRWSPRFDDAYTALDPGAADWVVARGIRLIGIDYLSIQSFIESDEVHLRLLTAGVVVLEGLDLSLVEPGDYELICLPLRLTGIEGAPARAMLRPL